MRTKKTHLNSFALVALIVSVLLSTACRPVAGTITPQTLLTQTPAVASSVTSSAVGAPVVQTPRQSGGSAGLTATSVPLATPSVTPSVLPSVTPSVTPTVDPYEAYTIDYLSMRSYGGEVLEIQETLAANTYFTRTLFTYPSDGLAIAGFMDLPRGPGPFPVVIAIHGYIDPAIYKTLDYTTGYADALARSGFLVLHPNLRDYPPSDAGDTLFRVGMAIDVLNLIALVKSQGGLPGPLERANPEAIGLWGHSMGGGVTTRVLTISPDVRAAVLYAAMSGDERQNYEAIQRWSDGERGLEELEVPESGLTRISPIYFLDRIQAPVSIHHGKADTLVPPAWSLDLCNRLVDLGKDVSCFLYDGEPHTFYGEGEALFKGRVVDFFNRALRP